MLTIIIETAFRRSYEAPILSLQLPECDEDQLEIGNDCAAQLSHLTSQFVLRRTQQVMTDHLPPKVESVIFCRPSPAQVIKWSQNGPKKKKQSFNQSPKIFKLIPIIR